MTTNVLHLTDLHLMCDAAAVLKGVPTRQSWIEVLQYVTQGVASGRWDFDSVVITGDLAHDEQLATYEILRESLGDWVSRCRFLPGNHDDRAFIRRVFPESVPAEGTYVTFSFSLAGWRLVGLDSHLPGEVAGQVGREQIEWMREELERNSAQPTIVFVHHPPFSVHSSWLDDLGMRDSAPVLELIASFPQVRAVCAGHVHQQFTGRHNGLELLTTPSTAVQFRPCAEKLVCDPIAPGFRILSLENGNDRYETSVVRLPQLRFPPET